MLDIKMLKEQKRIYIDYLTKVCIPSEDWHGAADACMDLREVDAKLSVLADLNNDDDTYT